MTARVELPDPIERTITESNAAKRVIRAIRDGFAGPDALLHCLMDAFEADGRMVAPTAGVRGYMREVQKFVESTRTAAPRT